MDKILWILVVICWGLAAFGVRPRLGKTGPTLDLFILGFALAAATMLVE